MTIVDAAVDRTQTGYSFKPPLATARAASRDGRVQLFVCLFVGLLPPNSKNAIFSKTKQFRAIVSIDYL